MFFLENNQCCSGLNYSILHHPHHITVSLIIFLHIMKVFSLYTTYKTIICNIQTKAQNPTRFAKERIYISF